MDLNKENVWIVKPFGLSRSRGILISNDIAKILAFVFSSDTEFVI